MRPGCRRLLTAAAPAVAVVVVTVPAGAQSRPSTRIDLIDQTVIVDAAPASFELLIEDPPDGARLEICVSRPVTDREELRDAHVDPPRDCAVANYPELLDELADDDTPGHYTVTIPDEDVGELLRRDDGALPVVIELVAGGAVLDRLVTQLLVVPDDKPAAAVANLSFVADAAAELAHLPDGTVADTAPALAAVLASVEALPPEAVTLALRPETLAAAATTPAALEPIVAGLRRHELLLEPWVGIDEEGWRLTGETDMVLHQYTTGRATIEDLADGSPTGVVRLDPDGVAATIGLLRTAGATATILTPDVVDAGVVRAADHRPVNVSDDNGVPMPAMIVDDRLAETLDGSDRELAVHRALAELVMVTFAADDDRAVLLDLDSVEPEAAAMVLDRAADIDRIRPASLTSILELPLARTTTGRIVEVRLRAADPPDLEQEAAVQRFARASVDAYEGMVTSTAAPIVPLRTLLMASVDDDLDADGRADYTTAVLAAVADGTSGITIVESERITLATRTADLPMTIRNEQSLAVTVELRLRAEKLRFPDGNQQTIELQPGDNALTVRAEARASGDARVTATLTSPDGRLALDETVIPVRSTALSGLGLLLSAVALAVLLVWWIRTVRRTRRARGPATVPASAGHQADPVRGDPGAQGSMEES